MAYIRTDKAVDGSTRFTAVVRIRTGAVVLHQEAKTFSLRTHAEKWAKHREVALEDPASPLRQKSQPRTLEAARHRCTIAIDSGRVSLLRMPNRTPTSRTTQ